MRASDHARAQVFSRSFPPFDATEYLEGAWGILRGDLVTVRVLFSKAVARYIAERLWHPSQKLRELDDGRLEVTLRVADTLEVRRWILGYGVHAEALEPATLREALRADAEALVDRLTPIRRPLAATPSPKRRPAAGPCDAVAATGTARRSPTGAVRVTEHGDTAPARSTLRSPGRRRKCRDERKSRITDSSNGSMGSTPTAGVTIPVTVPPDTAYREVECVTCDLFCHTSPR
jgi:hypothetical protein